ncbi:MAG: ribbon-helix-helix domain-containing protein [Bryobacteraceae bacterium]|nr:ribbon-helix-helix domain-containing protein [Bryobacteraceae bacterium]
MPTSTSSFRIEEDLRIRLEQAARATKRGKNALINEALTEYLNRIDQEAWIAEAQRQSRLVSARMTEDEQFWMEQADLRGWK